MDLAAMVAAGIAGKPATKEQALEILAAPDEQTLEIVAAAGKIRRHFFGNTMKLNYLVNLKSGLCPEDCNYCSQAMKSNAEILRYNWLDEEQIDAAVRAGVENGASTLCLVASGRASSNREVERVAGIVRKLHEEYPKVKICTCLGFIDEKKAEVLIDAGSTRYNHNLNTAKSRYPEICTTHTFQDRVDTVKAISSAGMSPCTGMIAGMGETDEQLVEIAFQLRELNADSIPVNFLLPFEGTPLESHRELTPQRCLKILAMMRFVNPDTEVRSAAGREYHIRTLQPLVFEICNSIFLGDYLTSEGEAGAHDLRMLKDAGFVVVERGAEEQGEVCAGENETMVKIIDKAGIAIRHRGVGTNVPANA